MLPELRCDSPIFDVQFHQEKNLVAASTVGGAVKIWTYTLDDFKCDEWKTYCSDSSVRTIKFNDGDDIAYGNRKGVVGIMDVNTLQHKMKTGEEEEGVNALLWVSPQVLASGTDNGIINLWDARQPQPLVATIDECDDQIFSLKSTHSRETLFALSGDKLAVFDLRSPGRSKLAAMSDEQEEDLLCMELARHESRIVCGTATGAIGLFVQGDYGDIKERIVGLTESIDAMCKLSENVLLVGSGDGRITVISLYPNKIRGLLADYHTTEDGESMGIGALSVDRSKRIVAATCTGEDFVRFHWTETAFAMADDAKDVEMTSNLRNDFFDEL